MILKPFKRLFGNDVPKQPREISQINELETEVSVLDLNSIKSESESLKKQIADGKSLDEVLPMAYALVREAAKRTLNQRHFDTQLWGGIVLNQGSIAEMMTGEGKTLTATLAAYLNALTGKGVHVITVNDYLAKRDTVWMGQIYHALGLKTACVAHDSAYIYDPEHTKDKKEGTEDLDKDRDERGSFFVHEEYLRPVSRKEAYEADITYGTNHEFGFDYLRDNLVQDAGARVQRPLHFAIIDEVDSILIDEARTPLIISVADKQSSEYYKVFARAVKNLVKEEDYLVDEKLKSVEILESGIDKVERMVGVKDLYAVENIRMIHYLEASLKAKAIFERDKDYVVKDGEIVIVDQFTGRLMPGRRYSAGLHQAIEAKEGVFIKEETRTYAQVTIQNYFRMYEKISGMTGTALTSSEEFNKVYNLGVVSIPPNKPLIRIDHSDRIFKDIESKYRAIIREVKERHKVGQPVLIGTVSIEKNELLGKLLREEGIPFEILNAKNHEREGSIIAQAGRMGAITVATNMAGRGVDIILGGSPLDKEEAEKVRELGGLCVIGTERHEARRIDDQLKGRAGRQGDPGSTQFFLSLDDDLLRIFGGDRIKTMMARFNFEEEIPQSKFVSKIISQSQTRVEGFNFDARKHLLEYDDILNKQRKNFYSRRLRVLEMMEDESALREYLHETLNKHLDRLEESDITNEDIIKILISGELLSHESTDKFADKEEAIAAVREILEKKIPEHKNIKGVAKQVLSVLDFLWMNHLEDIEALIESVRLRAYGQRDPLIEYRRESHQLFEGLKANFESWVFNNIFKLDTESGVSFASAQKPVQVAQHKELETGGIGRNDPCPCGAINPNTGEVYKFKKCGMINAPHHKK